MTGGWPEVLPVISEKLSHDISWCVYSSLPSLNPMIFFFLFIQLHCIYLFISAVHLSGLLTSHSKDAGKSFPCIFTPPQATALSQRHFDFPTISGKPPVQYWHCLINLPAIDTHVLSLCAGWCWDYFYPSLSCVLCQVLSPAVVCQDDSKSKLLFNRLLP